MLFITVAADFLKVKKHQSVCTAFEGCQSEDLTWVSKLLAAVLQHIALGKPVSQG